MAHPPPNLSNPTKKNQQERKASGASAETLDATARATSSKGASGSTKVHQSPPHRPDDKVYDISFPFKQCAGVFHLTKGSRLTSTVWFSLFSQDGHLQYELGESITPVCKLNIETRIRVRVWRRRGRGGRVKLHLRCFFILLSARSTPSLSVAHPLFPFSHNALCNGRMDES